MKAIRGATTVAADTPQEIRTAVKEMLDAIASENSIGEEDMIFLLFSNTEDVRSLYPAKAAREAGYTLPALFSAAEPAIEGSLPLCIRVMVLAGNGRETQACLFARRAEFAERSENLCHCARRAFRQR